MTGREDRKENDLFFTCSLIDYIARKTKNKRADIVTMLGKDAVARIYDLADVYTTVTTLTVSAMILLHPAALHKELLTA